MFTGLVESLGRVREVQSVPPGLRLTLHAPQIAAEAAIGASIAVSGCCLTVVQRDSELLVFELGEETLRRTILGQLQPGAFVNLERSLRLGDPLDGHLVTGHVDGIGRLVRRNDQGEWSDCWFEPPVALMPQLASKGSVAVDGVSLTLVEVTDTQFSVALIPHTLAVTTLGQKRVGDPANLETDVLAKYVQRQLAWRDNRRV
jgi:riboflavin synthase